LEGSGVIQRFVPVSVVLRHGEQKEWRIWDRQTSEFLQDHDPPDETTAWEIAESLNHAAEAHGLDGESYEAYLESRPVDPARKRCRDCRGAMHTIGRCPFGVRCG
jgi:hypothetical protein